MFYILLFDNILRKGHSPTNKVLHTTQMSHGQLYTNDDKRTIVSVMMMTETVQTEWDADRKNIEPSLLWTGHDDTAVSIQKKERSLFHCVIRGGVFLYPIFNLNTS